eukprot:scaffold7236_cov69-Phaeocystis_antarctica.AAC.11
MHQVVKSGQRLLAERARARLLARVRDHLPPCLRRHGPRNGRRPREHFLDGRFKREDAILSTLDADALESGVGLHHHDCCIAHSRGILHEQRLVFGLAE